MRRAAPFLFVLLLVAGCISAPADDAPASPDASGAGEVPVFSGLKLIDEVRAGGEPVIAITPTGTILISAHPGWTHTRYPPGSNLLVPASGQSYLWRSTDGGETFAPIGLPNAPNGMGPRGIGQGVSDPDFAVDSNGRIYLTDLEALAAASVSWSDDDGATWLMGNNAASAFGRGGIDRQWLATLGTDVYLVGNFFTAQKVLRSTDGGIVWSEVGAANCNGDIMSTRAGALIAGCGTGIDVSEDEGVSFEERVVPDAKSWARVMAEPAEDDAGNVYTTWSDADGVFIAGTPDLGRTWWPSIRVADAGTNVWPWVVAGAAGRVAAVWYHTDDPAGPGAAGGDWFVEGAIVHGADTAAPVVSHARIAGPIFRGHMCQEGTVCQADPDPETGDRRLGDFFEAAVDAEGSLHIAFSVALDDSISHPGYVKQVGGPRLR